MNEPDRRVPGYLGRVLHAGGEPVGTCFQLAPGLLATAWHVLDGVRAGELGDVVRVDPLAGGDARDATVVAIDPLADLAVLNTDLPLDASIAQLRATDGVPLGRPVVVTGVSHIDDPGHVYRYLDAAGEWAGGTTRDDQLPLGRMRSSDVMPGMSGAPVRLLDGDVVVGVVSGRYNTADGWLQHSVWVARCERLGAMCEGFAPIAVADPARPAGAVDLVLEVGDDEVRLSGPGIDVAAPHQGVRPGLRGAVDDVRRARALAGGSRATAPRAQIAPGELTLERAGRLLAECFLPEPVAAALGSELTRADLAHQAVRLGVACDGPFARLPWEALPDPRGGRPLALLPLVNVHRRAAAPPPSAVPGPLRILVAIASPDHGGGAVLDYERELRNVLAAVRTARADGANVRVVRFATPAAIRAALDAAPAHILHLSGHGAPGSIVFERDDGGARKLDADAFVDEAIPPSRMPAVIALAACHTNVAAATGSPSFAARLLQRGASVVIASETSVTDGYATRVFARIYERLAGASEPDVLAAVCDARRTVQAELDSSTDERERRLGSLGEWAVVSVLAPAGAVPVFDPSMTAPLPPLPARVTIGAVTARAVGDFVGRRGEQRRWPAELLAAERSGIVLHGIGGVGKTTLAEELVGAAAGARARAGARSADRLDDRRRRAGHLDVDLGRELRFRGKFEGVIAQALGFVARTDVPWSDRLTILRQHVLGSVPLLVVLDNFEDNLDTQGPGAAVRDPILAALLAAWVADPGLSRLLVTCRFPFALPDGAESRMSVKALGPLSAAETRKLIWSLPALDRLTDEEADRVWRMVGGHPRSLEYLDALLSRGEGRYPDITTRLAKAVSHQLGGKGADEFLQSERELDGALAAVATLAADDVLLDDLLASLRATPGAEALLIGASVYREPVAVNALLFQVGEPDEAAATTPDAAAANERIRELLEAAGIATDEPVDPAELPADLLAAITPHIAELQALPTPPHRPPADLSAAAGACMASSLLAVAAGEEGERFFVHRWTAGELDRRLTDAGRATEITEAHVRAADYWRWRVAVWPQNRRADVHDLLEARHHHLRAGQVEQAGAVTEAACLVLDDLGSWDDEAAVIHDTLARLPDTSERRWAWIHQLGINRAGPRRLRRSRGALPAIPPDQRATRKPRRHGHRLSPARDPRAASAAATTKPSSATSKPSRSTSYSETKSAWPRGTTSSGWLAHDRGDYEKAEQRYQQALQIKQRLGNQAAWPLPTTSSGGSRKTAASYETAEQRYQQALQINERLGNQADMANNYGQLGVLAELRGDYDDAEQRCQQSLEIDERLGNQAGMASSYHQLGILAQLRGDYDEAEQRYQQSIQINERLGNQAGMASGYHQLGMLAQYRGHYDEAEQRYQQSIQIKSDSETKPAWPAATTSSGCSRTTAATTTKPSRATGNPSRSRNDSETKPAWPPATASWAPSRPTEAISRARSHGTDARSQSARSFACRRWPSTPGASPIIARRSVTMPSGRPCPRASGTSPLPP